MEALKEYAGHGFRYGGSASQINKMQMKVGLLCQCNAPQRAAVHSTPTAMLLEKEWRGSAG